MAASDEIIRYVYEVSGSAALREVSRDLLAAGDASGDVEQSVKNLADEFGALARQVDQAKGLQAASATFKALASEVLATERNIVSAKGRVAELGKALGDTAEPTKKQTREFENARKELERLERVQTNQRAKLTELKNGFTEAGLSTRNLVAAEKELAARLIASQAAMAGIVASARSTTAARQQSAQAERALLDQLRNTVAQQQQAARATESLQRARELLANRSQSASASERAYAQSLGTSAAKIAAIGAAAIGITSAVGLARNGLSQLIETAGKFQKLDVQLDAVFGGQSTEALKEIQDFARETPFQLQQVSDAFVKLKAFGLDPLDGTFQAISDQASKLGGSQETLTGITLALGQAQAKQKLQGEEILQLVERGVPVWDLLARATGKSTAELQKLSEAGKLGRTEIKLLIDEIGASSKGASAALADTLPGQINRLNGQWKDFLNLIANSGVLDYLQTQLANVSAEVQRMADSGELQAWAKDIADAIVSAAQAIQGVTGFLFEHRDAIAAVAAAYAAFKGAQLIAGLAQAFASLGASAITATKSLLGTATTSIAAAGQLGLLAAALAFTTNAAFNLVNQYEELRAEWELAEATAQDFLDTHDALIEKSRANQEQYEAFANVAIEKSTELATRSQEDTGAYIKQLEGAIEFTRALGFEAIATGDNIGRLAARGKLDDLEAALEAAQQRMVEFRDASALAFESVGPFGVAAAEAFDAIVAGGKSAKDAVDSIFKDVDLTQQEGLAKAAAAVKAIGTRGTEAAAQIRDELRAEILKLSDEDFAKFKASAANAFAAGVQGAHELQGAIAGINLERLGVDVEEIRTGFSSAGRAAVEAFAAARKEVDTLGFTAEQRAKAIGIAFDNALGKAKTTTDLQALRNALSAAFDAGEVGIDAYLQKLEEIKTKVASIKPPALPAPNTAPVTDALAKVSQSADSVSTSLQNVGTNASGALEGVQQGTQAAAASLQQVNKQAGETAAGVGSAAQAITNIYEGFAGELGKTSQAAIERFTDLTRQIFNLSAGIADFSGLARFGKAAQDAFAIVSGEIDKQKIGVAALADQYNSLSEAAILDDVRMRGGFENAAEGLDLLAQSAREGNTEFDLLAQQDLAPLANAAAAAAARVRQIGEEAAGAVRQLQDLTSSLQDQIDQANGNREAQEARRYAADLQRAKDLAEQAGNLDQGAYNEAVAAAERLHQIRLANIRKEKEAERERDSGSSQTSSGSSSGSGTNTHANSGSGSTAGGGIPISINLGGQSATVTVANQAAANQLLEILRRAMLASGGGGSLLG